MLLVAGPGWQAAGALSGAPENGWGALAPQPSWGWALQGGQGRGGAGGAGRQNVAPGSGGR